MPKRHVHAVEFVQRRSVHHPSNCSVITNLKIGVTLEDQAMDQPPDHAARHPATAFVDQEIFAARAPK